MKKTIRAACLAVPLALIAASADAVQRSDNGAPGSQGSKRTPTPQRAVPAAPARYTGPVVVSATGPNQTGYVHYFVITGPDGEPESHVGIELPGDRIAWSFPGLGVTIAPFTKAGTVVADGKPYDVEHLYGLRPLRDDESLRVLQRALEERVAWWIEQKTAYCDEERPSGRLCVSCLGFVLRVLYPGPLPVWPVLPADFRGIHRNVYTTEDLLLYLSGVRIDAPREARLKRVAELAVPDTLREELTRLALMDAAPPRPGDVTRSLWRRNDKRQR